MVEQTILDTKELEINMGPQHPSTHGVLRVKLKLDGERVLDAECIIGYLHRGIEKISENRSYINLVPYFDRTDYIAAVSNVYGYLLGVEKMVKGHTARLCRQHSRNGQDSAEFSQFFHPVLLAS